MGEGGSLTITANGGSVKCGLYGLVNVPVAEAAVVLNGGTYTATTDNGAFIKLRAACKDVTVELNDVTYTDASDDGFILNADDSDEDSYTLTVVGGNYTANAGFQVLGEGTITGATISTRGYAFEVYGGDATISDCVITVDPSVVVGTAPGAGVAVAGEGYALVEDCEITAVAPGVCLSIYSTDGSIVANGCTLTGPVSSNYGTKDSSTITIND